MNTSINSASLIYFDNCPSWKEGLKSFEEALGILGIDKEIKLVSVETNEQAIEQKFSGSPMFRINGNDLFPTNTKTYSLGCRVYAVDGKYRGSPTVEMIVEKIKSI